VPDSPAFFVLLVAAAGLLIFAGAYLRGPAYDAAPFRARALALALAILGIVALALAIIGVLALAAYER
jgi:hypothetical protein